MTIAEEVRDDAALTATWRRDRLLRWAAEVERMEASHRDTLTAIEAAIEPGDTEGIWTDEHRPDGGYDWTASALAAIARLHARIKELEVKLALVEQGAGDYCEECGWNTVFPEPYGCVFCAQLEKDREVEAKDARVKELEAEAAQRNRVVSILCADLCALRRMCADAPGDIVQRIQFAIRTAEGEER